MRLGSPNNSFAPLGTPLRGTPRFAARPASRHTPLRGTPRFAAHPARSSFIALRPPGSGLALRARRPSTLTD